MKRMPAGLPVWQTAAVSFAVAFTGVLGSFLTYVFYLDEIPPHIRTRAASEILIAAAAGLAGDWLGRHLGALLVRRRGSLEEAQLRQTVGKARFVSQIAAVWLVIIVFDLLSRNH